MTLQCKNIHHKFCTSYCDENPKIRQNIWKNLHTVNTLKEGKGELPYVSKDSSINDIITGISQLCTTNRISDDNHNKENLLVLSAAHRFLKGEEIREPIIIRGLIEVYMKCIEIKEAEPHLTPEISPVTADIFLHLYCATQKSPVSTIEWDAIRTLAEIDNFMKLVYGTTLLEAKESDSPEKNYLRTMIEDIIKHPKF